MEDSAIVEVGGDSCKPAVEIGHVVADVVADVAAAAIDGIVVVAAAAAEVGPIAVVGMGHLLS